MTIHTRSVAPAVAVAGSASCRLCGASLERTLVDLGMSPLCESFIEASGLDAMEPYYPLKVLVCTSCFLVQLKEYVTPEHIFSEYAYFSSFSTSWVAHAKRYAEQMTQQLALGPESLVVELASNDGYLLQHFLPLRVPVLGIEPAGNVANAALAKGVNTRIDFFGRRLASELAAAGVRADLIVGNNVLAQVPDLNDFASGIPLILKPQGVATLEFPHLVHLMDQNQFDTIYHEHFSYFSLIAIERLAALHGLKVVDVEELATHGGSLRVHLMHEAAARPISAAVGRLLEAEARRGLRDIKAYSGFAERVRETKRALLALLIALKGEGKRICGYGAPGKGNTLLNYCGIGTDFLDFTVDRNTYKHGRFTPGMHIPIRPVAAIDAERPDYILILPWNLKAEIMAQMRHVSSWGAKFIVPIPTAQVVDPKEFGA